MERDVLTEQRTNIKFLVKLGKNGHERDVLQHHMSMRTFNVFRFGTCHDLVKANCRIITRMIAEKLEISNGSVRTILKEDSAWICIRIFAHRIRYARVFGQK
ncbi:hypothetical protein ALC56_14527 [Trachymyrmex septentrionalis]|uniref:Mos1 transposase HTH domain-containing protein n=1 Tax=Trachymyrmex septentrionalis TaxID=34720 RepID=A0A195ESB4_9HYME|nr:hypothetical protein ALC56_14527 [Trachymyrmex septentrionalis]